MVSFLPMGFPETGFRDSGIDHLSFLKQPLGRDEFGTHEKHVRQLEGPRICAAGPDHQIS
jgi:hypothetical protein